MCAIGYCIVLGDGLCEVHQKHPTLEPLEVGWPTPHPGCTKAEAEYILQACGEPPEDEDDEVEDIDHGIEDAVDQCADTDEDDDDDQERA